MTVYQLRFHRDSSTATICLHPQKNHTEITGRRRIQKSVHQLLQNDKNDPFQPRCLALNRRVGFSLRPILPAQIAHILDFHHHLRTRPIRDHRLPRGHQ